MINTDVLHKINLVYSLLNNLFADVFYPYQNLVVDESLLLFKGRLRFRQFIPSKRSRFGIKFFVLCDCLTGYVLKIIIYTGALTTISRASNLGVS